MYEQIPILYSFLAPGSPNPANLHIVQRLNELFDGRLFREPGYSLISIKLSTDDGWVAVRRFMYDMQSLFREGWRT